MDVKKKRSFYIYITVLMTMTLMTLWLEPSSMERMIIANLNFILHLFCLLDVQWRIPFNGIQTPNLSNALIFTIIN